MAKANKVAKPAPPVSDNVLAVRQDALPAFMQGKQGMGVEHLGADAVEIPRLQLLQALSPQVAEGSMKQGNFFHSIAEVELGNEAKIVIVYADQSFILWRPRHEGGGILARAQDGIHWSPPDAEFEVHPSKDNKKHIVTWKTAKTVAASGLSEWGSSDRDDPNSPPAATRMYNLVCMLPDFPEYSPCIVTLQRSAIKVARKLMGKLKIAQAPCFGLEFTMASVRDSNSQNQDFWNYAFTASGFVQDEDNFKLYEGMYETFKKEGVRIRNIEGLQDDDIPAAAKADEAGAAAAEKHKGKM